MISLRKNEEQIQFYKSVVPLYDNLEITIKSNKEFSLTMGDKTRMTIIATLTGLTVTIISFFYCQNVLTKLFIMSHCSCYLVFYSLH